jgi:predicted Zn-dependent peptidase
MPSTVVKSIAKDTDLSEEGVEELWKEAKEIAKDEGHENDWPYITTITKRLAKAKSKEIEETKENDVKNNVLGRKKFGVIDITKEFDRRGYSYFSIGFDGGPGIETKGTYGLSHLAEHLLHYNNQDLFEKWKVNGISNNAFTSSDNMVFYMQGLTGYLEQFIPEFTRNILSGINCGKERFEAEKNVVIQEVTNVFNKPGQWHMFNRMRRQFNHYGSVGLIEDLENATYEDFQEFVKNNYEKPSRIISFSDHDLTDFDNIEFDERDKPLRLKSGNYIAPFDGRIDEKAPNTTILGVSDKSISTDKEYYILNAVCDILGGSPINSPWGTELREKHSLVYGFSVYPYETDRRIHIGIETMKVKKDKVYEVMDGLLEKTKGLITEKAIKNSYLSSKIAYKKRQLSHIPSSVIGEYESGELNRNYEALRDIEVGEIYDVADKFFSKGSFTFTSDMDLKGTKFKEEEVVTEAELEIHRTLDLRSIKKEELI